MAGDDMTQDSLLVLIDGHPPNPNSTVRKHYMANRTVFDRWKADTWAITRAAMDRAGWVAPVGRAHVAALFHYPDRRRRDPDNAAASLKPIMDGLVLAGALVDDDFAHVALTVDAEFGHSTRTILISISEMTTT